MNSLFDLFDAFLQFFYFKPNLVFYKLGSYLKLELFDNSGNDFIKVLLLFLKKVHP